MFWIGDKFFSNEQPADRATVPDLSAIAEEHRQLELRRFIKQKEHSDIYYYGYAIQVEYAVRSAFVHLPAFFVNTEAAQQPLQTGAYRDWLWNPVAPGGRLSHLCKADKTSVDLLEALDRRARLEAGWLLHREHGRVDADITCYTEQYLVQTAGKYFYISFYNQILH